VSSTRHLRRAAQTEDRQRCPMRVSVNTRILASPTTGVQRYLTELLERIPTVQTLAPVRRLAGLAGHAWEQGILPAHARGTVLWSPSNTGPLAVHNQVVTIHDVVPLEHPEWLNARFAAWYRFLIPRLARRAARVIAVSEFTKERLLAYSKVDPDKITVVHSGVGKQFSPRPACDVARARAALSIPDGPYVLAVGSLEPRKNLGRLLAAWARLLQGLPANVSLVVTGGKGKQTVFADVPELRCLPERVHLTDYAPDEVLPGLYTGASVFVYPSVYEGFGLPPLEAMACGTPVIVGNRASLPEVVGDAGVSVNPYDIDAIATAIAQVLVDPAIRAKLAPAALQRASRFSWDRAATQTWNVLCAAADSH